ncbi:MAG: hypothetical protein JSU58_01705 [Dehalococcoidales bacterium]|nr:MAG: hypothetical protein JSU58_01705 [Dehalococcoidales bacterium]
MLIAGSTIDNVNYFPKALANPSEVLLDIVLHGYYNMGNNFPSEAKLGPEKDG